MLFSRIKLNRKRHLLLKELSEKSLEQDIESQIGKVDADLIGLSFKEVRTLLGVSKQQVELVISELEKNNEIGFYEFKERGCFIITNGIAALAEKKYKRKNQDIYLNWLRNFVQLFIPVISLIIAYVALTTSITKNQKEQNIEIEKLEQRIESLEKSKIKLKKNASDVNAPLTRSPK